MTARRYSKLDRRFRRGKRRKPVKPSKVPRPHELPTFRPEEPEQLEMEEVVGHYVHWTEMDPKVKKDIIRFAKRTLGFKDPVMEQDSEVTGSVDAIVWDRGSAAQPCVAFEVKSAKPWIKDKHARTGKRSGRYQIDPAQHEERLSDTGRCPLYYVLAGVDEKAEKVERVGICSLDMVEEIVEGKLTEPRGIHYNAAYECPSASEWPKIKWTSAEKKLMAKREAQAKRQRQIERELEDVPF